MAGPAHDSGKVRSAQRTVWCRQFEARWDSELCRDWGFAALNRLTNGPLNAWWRQQRVEHFEGVDIPVAPQERFPGWLRRLWLRSNRLGWVRYCPQCIRRSYHSIFHECPRLTACPWHKCLLTTRCRRCRAANAYEVGPWDNRFCRRCGCELFPADPRCYWRDAAFLRQEASAFATLITELKHLGGIEVDIVPCLGSRCEPSPAEVFAVLQHLLPDNEFLRAFAPTIGAATEIEFTRALVSSESDLDECLSFHNVERRLSEQSKPWVLSVARQLHDAPLRVAGNVYRAPSSPLIWSWVIQTAYNPAHYPPGLTTKLRHAVLIRGLAQPVWGIASPFGASKS